MKARYFFCKIERELQKACFSHSPFCKVIS